MKRLKRTAVITVSIIMMLVQVAYANSPSWESLPGHHNQSTLRYGALEAEDIVQSDARGTIMSTAILKIVNEQNGNLYITSDILVHKKIDKAYQTVFLDEWDEENSTWVQIGRWDFERSKEEEENGEMLSYHVGFTVTGCVVNRYYRARAMHLVQIGDDMEGKATETDGVLLTDHEV